jgi:hypothetical protein
LVGDIALAKEKAEHWQLYTPVSRKQYTDRWVDKLVKDLVKVLDRQDVLVYA